MVWRKTVVVFVVDHEAFKKLIVMECLGTFEFWLSVSVWGTWRGEGDGIGRGASGSHTLLHALVRIKKAAFFPLFVEPSLGRGRVVGLSKLLWHRLKLYHLLNKSPNTGLFGREGEVAVCGDVGDELFARCAVEAGECDHNSVIGRERSGGDA